MKNANSPNTKGDETRLFPGPHLRPLRHIIIFGSGGHAVSVANVARSAGYEICGFVDPRPAAVRLLGYPILSTLDEIAKPESYGVAIAVGDNALRERIHSELLAEDPSLIFPSLVHQSATVAHFARLGEGTMIMPHAAVGPNSTVGRFCIVNTHASLDHDCVMLDYASLAPRVVTGGRVQVGTRTAVSIGACVKQGIVLGSDSVVGANSYVNSDVPSNWVVYGTPARRIRARSIGEPYL